MSAVKVSISMPGWMFEAATAKAETDPRYRTLSGYVQNLLDHDLHQAKPAPTTLEQTAESSAEVVK